MTNDPLAQRPRSDGDAAERPTAASRSAPALAQHLDLDTLQAYLDRELPGPNDAAARGHLARCTDCRRELSELRATMDLLRGLPHYASRRSFRLGPEYAREPSGGWLDRFRFALPALPALRAATVAVAVLLVAVTAGDLVTDEADQPLPAPVIRQEAEEDAAEIVVEEETGTDTNAPASERGGGQAPAPAAGPPLAQEAGRRTEPALTVPAGIVEAPEPESAAGAEVAASTDDEPSGWRLAQLGLGLLLLWLLVSVVGLQRLRRRDAAAEAAGAGANGDDARSGNERRRS